MQVKFKVSSFECIGLRPGSAICAQTDRQTYRQTHISKDIISATAHLADTIIMLAINTSRTDILASGATAL